MEPSGFNAGTIGAAQSDNFTGLKMPSFTSLSSSVPTLPLLHQAKALF